MACLLVFGTTTVTDRRYSRNVCERFHCSFFDSRLSTSLFDPLVPLCGNHYSLPMPFTFRVGTFNFENLFSRARVLNLQDHARTAELLTQVGQLEQLLGKATYSAEDKTQIKKLAEDLSTYIEIREDRGKLFTGRGSTRRVTASGASAWDGGVDFKRADISDMARESTITVVKTLDADLLCCVEIEDRQILQAFNSQALDSKKFKYSMLIDGNDPRGIDVGLLSNFEIVNIRTHIFDRDETGVVFSRDCLEVELKLPDGRPLYFLSNHLKSQGYGTQEGNDAKRRRQAMRLAQILREYNLARDLVIVAGDLNADPHDGDAWPGAMAQLLVHPRIQATPVPTSAGGARADRGAEGPEGAVR